MLTALLDAARTTRRPERAAYAAAAVATSVAGSLGWHRSHAVSKLMLMPMLQTGLVRRRNQLCPKGFRSLMIATAAAGIGDALLVGPAEGEPPAAARRRLRRGATAFGVQQLVYSGMLAHAGARPRRGSTAAVAGTLLGLAALDTAKESRPDPVVTTYGVLLGAMGSLALGMRGNSTSAELKRIPWGGAAFVASDAAILLREQLLKKSPLAGAAAEAFVLGSYALAQRLLVDGLAATTPA